MINYNINSICNELKVHRKAKKGQVAKKTKFKNTQNTQNIQKHSQNINQNNIINYISTKKELGKNLKEYREKNNFTQEDISKILKLHRTAVTSYERGNTSPNIFKLIKLAKLYNVNILNLVTL